jgi:O-antigen/teichoic acid export membrane protein
MKLVPIPAPSLVSPSSASKHSVPSIKRQAARGVVTLAVRYGLVICINVMGTVVLSRRLGPSLWGVYAIVQLIYLSSQEVLGRGLASYLIRKEPAPTSADIRNTFALQNWLGLAVMAAAIALSRAVAGWYGSRELRILLVAAGFASYGCAYRSVPLALLERDFDYGKVAIIEILENLVFYLVAIPLVWLGKVEAGLSAAVILRSWMPTLLAFLLHPLKPTLRFRLAPMAPIADFGFSMAGGSLVNIAILSIPAVLVGKLSGMRELGQAQMSVSLYSNLLFVTAAFIRLNLSAYSRLVAHTAEFAETVNQHLQLLAAALVPAIVLFAGLSPIWTAWVFGERWHGLSTVLLSQAPGYLLAAVFWGVLNPALLVSGKHRRLLYWLLAFTLIYGLLTRLLSPAWGAEGAAIAFSVTEIVLQPLLFWMYEGTHGKLEYRAILRKLAVGAGSVALIWYWSGHGVWQGSVAATAFLIAWCWWNFNLLESVRQEMSFARWPKPAATET